MKTLISVEIQRKGITTFLALVINTDLPSGRHIDEGKEESMCEYSFPLK